MVKGAVDDHEIVEVGDEDFSCSEGISTDDQVIRVGEELRHPIRYIPSGIFEEMPTLPPELVRPSVVEGQNWGNVQYT